MSENRDDRGQFRPEHGNREFLEAVAEREPTGTAEVADAVGVTRQNADRRLRALEDEGKLASKKIGGSLVWHVADGRQVMRSVDPEDDFWEAETFEGEAMSPEDVDDVLYG